MLSNKTYIFTAFLFMSFIFLGDSIITHSDPTIVSVSTSLSENVEAEGSLLGGTILYIKGTNFDPDASGNVISVGPYPCQLLAEGSNENNLACKTTPATNPDITWRLTVKVQCGSKRGSVSCNTQNCRFTYTSSQTPLISEIVPRSSVADTQIQIFGQHRISDLGDGRSDGAGQIKYLLLGNKSCSTIDIDQKEEFDPANRDHIICKTYKLQKPGEYDFTELVDPGYAQKSVRTQQTSYLTDQNYTQRVLPKISSLSSQEGGTLGHQVTLSTVGDNRNGEYECSAAGETCQVLSATQTSVKIKIPVKGAGNTDFGKLAKDAADASTQQKGYLGGYGIKVNTYKREGLWKTTSEWLTYLSGTPTIELVKTSTLTELSIGETENQAENDVVRYGSGYFHAPVAGTYTFSCVADDAFIMKLSNKKNNANDANLQDLLEHETWTSSHYNPNVRVNLTTVEATVTLDTGYYFFKFAHIDSGGTNFMKVMVQMPSLHAQTANPTWQIDEIIIRPDTYDAEQITIDAMGVSGGTYKLYYLQLVYGLYEEMSAVMDYGLTADTFKSRLSGLPTISNYSPTVQRISLDANKDPTSDPAAIAGYRYVINIDRYRAQTTLPMVKDFDPAKPVSTPTRTVTHSPPLSGTFRLNIAGSDLMIDGKADLSSDVPAWKILYALRDLYNADEIVAEDVKLVYRPDKIHLSIEYVGLPGAPEPITINTVNLKGGKDDTIKSVHTVKRPYSNLPLYNPIPLDFLYHPSENPSIILKVNKAPAICDDCSYQFNAAKNAVISTATLGGSTYTIALTNTGTAALTDIRVSLLGVDCTNLQGTTASFTCDFPANTDTSATLPAGTQKPIVHLATTGYADDSSLTAQTINLNVGSITPATSSPGGGVTATLVGNGFPIDSSKTFTLEVCGNTVTEVLTVSNQQITFTVPEMVTACSGNSQIVVNGKTATFTFTYDAGIAPSISSLNATSASPILKGQLMIQGSQFGNVGNTYVYLYQGGVKKYELNALEVSANQIRCVLGGGKTGEYDVLVFVDGVGLSSPSANAKFSYQIYVSSVSPVSGSMGGGYTLTITGKNFATDKSSNNVFVGNALNSVCSVTQSTSTQIKCTMPRMDAIYNSGDQLDIVVTGRIVEESTCDGTCKFAYDDSVTNNVTVPATLTYKNTNPVTISGEGLTGATVSVGGINCPLSSSTDSELTFNYPAVEAGDHEVVINTPTGHTYPQIMTSTPREIWNIISADTGSQKGHVVTIRGNGLPTDKTEVNAWLICSQTTEIEVISSVADLITVQIPEKGADSVCKLNVTIGTTFKVFTYTYDQAKTPAASIASSAANTYTLTQTAFTTAEIDSVDFVFLDGSGSPSTSVYSMTITPGTNTYTLTASYLPAGTFKVKAHSNSYGYADVTPSTVSVSFPSAPTATGVDSSFAGGKELTITGAGFITQNPSNNDIRVCGLSAEVKAASQTQITVIVPALITETTDSLYSLSKVAKADGTAFGDNSAQASKAFDATLNTIYTSDNANCHVGIDFGTDTVVDVTKIRFAPNPLWSSPSTQLEGAKFQGSNDMSTWTEIFTVDTQTVHSGWNTWKKETGTHKYRYVRFAHTTCELGDIQVHGTKFSTVAVTNGVNKQCDVTLSVDGTILANTVTYDHSKTSVITAISPAFGSTAGGTQVTLTGTNFGTVVSVMIDGTQCTVTSQTAVQIKCTTGARTATPTNDGNSMMVTSDGSKVHIAVDPFLYINRWTDESTWGGEAVPREGDSVYVPVGMTLLVDDSTPVLDTVIVEGKIVYADEKDMTFDAHYFIIRGGQFRVGTEASPYQHKLTITMHGGYYDKQLPIFGNKGIGCLNCKFDMHGKPKDKTWTLVENTIDVNQKTFTVVEAVDWEAGDKIAVASTTFDHYEAEYRTIQSVSVDGMTITVTEPFQYRHYAAIETYGGEQFVMRAEVGLLTRNVKMQGNSNSEADRYGSHLLLHGKEEDGLIGRISYAEFTKCGQPGIIGRYCTHFHMAGQVPSSFVRGIGVHHSMARVLTIHGTHYLLVEKNVGYYVEGHNIFVEDGIETHNVIQDNLMITSITSFTLLQSDLTVASYWITNPLNIVRRNHAAGGDFYGFWYEIKEHPDGPSATSDVCPQGMRIAESKDNVAHSNKRFGLRIFHLAAAKFPCLPTKDTSLKNPYMGNVAYENVFQNYTLWRNEECGFLGEYLGYTTIRNFRTADSRKGGIQFHKTNKTIEDVTADNCLVVGYSTGNAPANMDVAYNNARGVIASRTDGLRFNNIRFYNFGATMTPLQSCSECYTVKLWVTGGKTTKFNQISYNNILGNYIFWENHRREIFIDEDGSLTKPLKDMIAPAIPDQSNAMITPQRPSLLIPNHCYAVGGTTWDNSIFCDQTITLRGILFTNPVPKIDFNAIDIRVIQLADPEEDISAKTEDQFSKELMVKIKSKSMDIPNSWAMPFATGNFYNVHWKWGIDFQHMAIAPSRLWNTSDGVVLRFNYSDERELYQIGKMWTKKTIQPPYLDAQDDILDPATCNNGEYYHNNVTRFLYVCVSGRDKQVHEWTDLNGIRCLNYCPEDADGEREDFQRKWSNESQWPGQVKPKAGQNVTIPYEWNLLLDEDPPILEEVMVQGILNFDRGRDNVFQAKKIWVQKGKIKIGSADKPFTTKANIILHGNKDDRYMVVDSDASGNKMLAVTGQLQFYGNPPDTVWTRLTETATVGATEIKVAAATDWKVDDQLIIAPSYSGRKEDEKVTITAISGTTITFTPALQYEHYGAAGTTLSNNYGTLDARSAVGHITRNIKISAGADPNNWGCRVLVYSYLSIPQTITPTNQPKHVNGYAKFNGVEMDGCGQYDTTYAGLRIEKLGSQTPNEEQTIIENSAIHDCGGFCTYIDDVSNVNLTNNVFFNARKFLVYVEKVQNYTFESNLLIGARKRDELDLSQSKMVDDIACYEQYIPIAYGTTHNVSVKNNLAQGSEGEGFVFPLTPCDQLSSYPFIDNTAGSCQIAFMYEKVDGQTCLAASKMVGYASQIGLMANPPGSHIKIIYEDAFFADNGRGITLRYAHEIDDNTCILRNSYFTGFSRKNCTNCYGSDKINYCNNGYAIRMFTATISGETFPLKKQATVHDVICTRQSYDFKAYLNNVTFQNYLYDNPQLPYCSRMSIFRRHSGASDGTASHHLTNIQCINTEKKAWAYFAKPNVAWRGWFGGCGEDDCTGPNNYLVHDQDGSCFGEKSQLLSNHSEIGDNQESCEKVDEMNGHWCKTESLAVLLYESIAKDFNKRIMWPVYLNYDGGPWRSSTNGWKEWQWEGRQPMNLRLARFWSVIKLHKTYNLTYSSTPPADSRFQIQERVAPSGNPNDWVIIRIYYPLPNSIEVMKKDASGSDQLVKPYPLNEGVPVNLMDHVDKCGANTFHFQNGTIEFVVNGKDNCQVRVRLSSYIKLSVRIDIPIDDFYSNDGQTSFITNICAFLGIDTGRLKIVGVSTGSTNVDAILQSPGPVLDESTTGGQTPEEQWTDLHNISTYLNTGISNQQILMLGAVLSHETTVRIYNVDGSEYTPPEDEEMASNSLTMIIILAVVIPVFVIGVAVGLYCYIKRRRAKIETLEVEEIGNDSSMQGGIGQQTDDFSLKTRSKHSWAS